MNNLKIGWHEVNITPDKKASLAGQFAERISEYVEKPLTATAMAMENGSEQMVLCCVELLGISYKQVNAVREKLAGNDMGLDPMKIVFNATHTHTAPGLPLPNHSEAYLNEGTSFRKLLMDFLPEGRKYVENANINNNPEIITGSEYHELVVERLTEAVTTAWKNRASGSYVNAFGRASVGHCRRVLYSDGSAQMWGDTNTATFEEMENGNDDGVELLYTFDENKKLTGVVANLSCPAQCVQHRHFLSPDYWGEVRKLLRERFGDEICLLSLCAPAGDQCPVDMIRWVDPESDVNDPNLIRNIPTVRKADPSMFDLSGMRKAGKRIAREIIDVYEEGLDEPITAPVFEHRVTTAQLPLRRATLSDLNQAKKAIRDYLIDHPGDVNYTTAAQLQVHLGIVKRCKLQELMETLETEIHYIRLGDIAIATNPFELFLNYANQIRVRSKAHQTFLIQLANGYEGYLPTERAEKAGHYSAFIASGQVGHVAGEQVVREALKNIGEMFK